MKEKKKNEKIMAPPGGKSHQKKIPSNYWGEKKLMKNKLRQSCQANAM